ncbi:hypothetical protein RIF29_41083 [Crotalaria pallida]|uniref:Uncharacterized protein n=1 Tax=Crotalaria pallida TaxID=3830 RepID=A0AAN9E4B4_CROPI
MFPRFVFMISKSKSYRCVNAHSRIHSCKRRSCEGGDSRKRAFASPHRFSKHVLTSTDLERLSFMNGAPLQ